MKLHLPRLSGWRFSRLDGCGSGSQKVPTRLDTMERRDEYLLLTGVRQKYERATRYLCQLDVDYDWGKGGLMTDLRWSARTGQSRVWNKYHICNWRQRLTDTKLSVNCLRIGGYKIDRKGGIAQPIEIDYAKIVYHSQVKGPILQVPV